MADVADFWVSASTLPAGTTPNGRQPARSESRQSCDLFTPGTRERNRPRNRKGRLSFNKVRCDRPRERPALPRISSGRVGWTCPFLSVVYGHSTSVPETVPGISLGSRVLFASLSLRKESVTLWPTERAGLDLPIAKPRATLQNRPVRGINIADRQCSLEFTRFGPARSRPGRPETRGRLETGRGLHHDAARQAEDLPHHPR